MATGVRRRTLAVRMERLPTWHALHPSRLGVTACGRDYVSVPHELAPAIEIDELDRCCAAGCLRRWPPRLFLLAGGA